MQTDPSHSDSLTEALLHRLSTEVRHALHHVLGSVERVCEGTLSRAQTMDLENCRENMHELLRIVNDVSELADYGSIGESPRQFNMAEMLDEFCGLVQIRARRKGLDIHWKVDRGMPRIVLGYRQAIESAIYRLVDNSINYTARGAINITATLRAEHPLAPQIAIEVCDTGPGIAPGILSDLQKPHAEQHHPGLGLRLVRKQLENLGGRIEVVSSGAQGTALALVFPIGIPANAAIPQTDSSRPRSVESLHILVAEDSDDSFAVFEDFVKDEGHDITRAANGAEAVELFKSGNFNMVVMDINMPVMDGYTATKTIREWETQQGRTRSPILLVSAENAGRQMRIGSSVGCSGYLTKPTPKRELISALRHYAGQPMITRSN